MYIFSVFLTTQINNSILAEIKNRKDKKMKNVESEMREIKQLLNGLNSNIDKPLTIDEACNLTGYKKSYLYKLGHDRKIPFYKVNGGKVIYSERELKEWLFKNKHKSMNDIRNEAIETDSNMVGV